MSTPRSEREREKRGEKDEKQKKKDDFANNESGKVRRKFVDGPEGLMLRSRA